MGKEGGAEGKVVTRSESLPQSKRENMDSFVAGGKRIWICMQLDIARIVIRADLFKLSEMIMIIASLSHAIANHSA